VRLGVLDALLHVAHGVEVLRHLEAVGGSEAAQERRRLGGHRIEDAPVLAQAREPLLGIGGVAVAEEALEHDARLRLHRHGRRLVAPRDRVEVRAAVALLADADQLVLHAQLERSERCAAAQLVGDDLIERHARLEVRALGLLRMHAREERRARTGMVADGPFAREQRVRVAERQSAHDEHAIAERRQRRHDRRQLEAGAFPGGRPLVHDQTGRDVDHRQALDRAGGGAGERGHHAVEQRQRHAGAEAAQERPPGDCLLEDHHGPSDLRIWNGVLVTTPRMSDDQR
jgi:hypothetical protein